ncbi:hypothetical protein GCM10010172_35320 [Paractinoplanes ferrugineus]|uniref:Uncharacterized protein n=1 Tax=Paractinoplanes ferrugineus TaxID=113564 RepID=A0A919MIE2_9ACTN|nr:hypothetical protein Afe05nite_85980 [Actinoplanes ferrugineus]
MSLGMNASDPCPSDSHRRTALAHGRVCPICEPDAEWRACCPVCFRPVTAVGLVVQPHQTGGFGSGVKRQECRGAGSVVPAPEGSAWSLLERRLVLLSEQHQLPPPAVRLVPDGAA